MPSRINRYMKEEAVKKFRDCRNMILVSYKGLDSRQTTSLRDELCRESIQINVVKNRVTIFAFDELGKPEIKEFFSGPTAIMDGEDPVTMAKIAVNFAKREKVLEVKGGWIDGKVVSAAEIKRLAQLPSKEMLYAQVACTVAAPLTGLLGAMNATTAKIVHVLTALREKREEADKAS